MFQNVDQNLGSIREGTKKIIEYPFTEVNSIISTTASCGCTVANADKERGVLVVSFTAKVVPPHLWGQGWYSSCLTINVIYTTTANPTVPVTQKLTFSVRVIR